MPERCALPSYLSPVDPFVHLSLGRLRGGWIGGQKPDLPEHPYVIFDQGDGGMIGKLAAQVFGVKRLALADRQRDYVKTQGMTPGVVLSRLK